MSSRFRLRLNATLVTDRDEKFWLGAIVRDEEGKLWGLSSLSAFSDCDVSSIRAVGSPAIVGSFEQSISKARLPESVNSLIAAFAIDEEWRRSISPDFNTQWPRALAQKRELVGERYLIERDRFAEFSGSIIGSTNQIRIIRDGVERYPTLLLGSANRFRRSANEVIGSGAVTNTGVLAGIVIGTADEDLLILPLADALIESKLKLYVPYLAHWSSLKNLTQQVESLHREKSDLDFGRPPRSVRTEDF